ncbi:Superoxide dismutase 2 [Hibiscus syriacus]|uniref:superoxide dismutase n=1 Tax=Hibiscus syriacus TaxID=106335 RepID=A0A6A3CU64_HIBSY|nr:Superoxide dismutase 2 [Hibiscus syriacus]
MACHLLVADFTLPLKSPKLSHSDGLEPYMSKRALEVHWGVHHRGFVDDLNKQLGKSDILYGYTMDELVKTTFNNGNPLPQFNNAAEVWNHDFFWESMQPGGGDMPKLGLLEQIEKDFGSFTNFREKFVETVLSLFGSGWVWLVLKEARKTACSSENVEFDQSDLQPILNLDMWEHAYYLDYKNDKAKYVSTFMNHLVSWNAATLSKLATRMQSAAFPLRLQDLLEACKLTTARVCRAPYKEGFEPESASLNVTDSFVSCSAYLRVTM